MQDERSHAGLLFRSHFCLRQMLSPLLHEVRTHLQFAVDEVLPGANWCAPLPWCFGSQQYELAGKTSDFDLLVLAPEVVVERGIDIQAVIARRLCDKGVRRQHIKLQPLLQTLKWSDGKREVDVSLFIDRLGERTNSCDVFFAKFLQIAQRISFGD